MIDPLVAKWQGMQVITAPPPSSGGIGLLQLLLMKQALTNDFKGVRPNTARYVHLLAEIEKRVFADRAEYMGDRSPFILHNNLPPRAEA